MRLYTIFQILDVSVFEEIKLDQHIANSKNTSAPREQSRQLIVLDF